jgi:hypothetical protein
MTTEKRSVTRVEARNEIDVIDVSTGEPLGKLVNVSSGGFMLLGNSVINPNKLFQLRLVFSQPVKGCTRLNVVQRVFGTIARPRPPIIGPGFRLLIFQMSMPRYSKSSSSNTDKRKSQASLKARITISRIGLTR